MAEPGTDNDGARRTVAARLIDQACDGTSRRGQDNEFRCKSQLCDAVSGRDTVDLVVARIDEAEFALELGLANIVENGAADRAMARTGPDQRDGMRRKQILQTIGRHRSFVPGESRFPCPCEQVWRAMCFWRGMLTRTRPRPNDNSAGAPSLALTANLLLRQIKAGSGIA